MNWPTWARIGGSTKMKNASASTAKAPKTIAIRRPA